MTKKEFWDDYRSSQEKITLSDTMKNSILENTRRSAAERPATPGQAEDREAYEAGSFGRLAPAEPTAGTAQGKTASKGVTPTHPIPRRRVASTARTTRTARIALPIAACLALVALVAGITSFVGGTDDQSLTSDNPVPGFSLIRAYAAETDTILEMGNDNRIIFSRTESPYGDAPSGFGMISEENYYTGCLFRVEGEGIVRIQASVSTGALYKYYLEEITRGESPDRWSEIVGWKTTTRGLGKYYNGYDYVDIWGSKDDLPKDSPDKQFAIALTKKLGSTIDVPIDADSPAYSFGFWTNGDFGDVSEGLKGEKTADIINVFDGETLTVTATFADGRTITQVIELHAGDVKSSLEQDKDGLWVTVITPELIDPETAGLEYYTEYTHILYGVVKETNYKLFPGSLDNANEFEFIVDEPPRFERTELLSPSNQKIDPKDIHPLSDSLQMINIDWSGEKHQTFTVSNLTTRRSKSLPDGISLGDLRSGMGSWEYFNRVTGQMDGYTLDDAGTPSEGFSWVMFEADLTSDSDSVQGLWADGGHYGSLAVRDKDGYVSTVRCRSFALLNGGWDTSKPGAHGEDMAFDPHETKTIRWLLIVPDFVLDDPTLLYLPTFFDVEKQQQSFKQGFKLDLRQ